MHPVHDYTKQSHHNIYLYLFFGAKDTSLRIGHIHLNKIKLLMKRTDTLTYLFRTKPATCSAPSLRVGHSHLNKTEIFDTKTDTLTYRFGSSLATCYTSRDVIRLNQYIIICSYIDYSYKRSKYTKYDKFIFPRKLMHMRQNLIIC